MNFEKYQHKGTAMFYLKSIEINGIWGQRSIKTSFNRDVNIFIGYNGTGKTTFLNIITGILNVDIVKLTSVKFCDAKLLMVSNSSQQKTISVTMISHEILFKISKDSYHIPLVPSYTNMPSSYRDFTFHERRILSAQKDAREQILKNLQSFCDISDISVNRELHNTFDEYDRNRERERFTSHIDRKLTEVSKDICFFRNELDAEIAKVFSNFQNDMLTTMLYNEKFDTIEQMERVKYPLDKLQDGLLRAYKNVGLDSSAIEDQIKKHVQRIAHSLQVKEDIDQNPQGKGWAANDAFPLTSYRRTMHIVNRLDNAEKQRAKILMPWNLFLETFESFCSKKITLNANKNIIELPVSDYLIQLIELSSGEKQLFILLSEALLKRKKTVISITDEPELSLHISWQQRILPALRELNQNSQIIVATHSPEIAGSYCSKIIKMENILK